jgi:hypothetical protein
MRRTLIGLVAVGVLVGAGCGGDDDPASGGGGGGSPEEFCSTVQGLVMAASSEDADPAAARETLSDLDPPDAIADEWNLYLPLVTGSAEIDPDDAEAQAEYQQQMQDAEEAGAAISRYLSDECGIEGEPTGDDASVTTDAQGDTSGE